MKDETSLVVIDVKDISTLLLPGGLEPTLTQLRKIQSEFVSDITTEKGRKAVASFSYKFARSKTYVDSLGKKHLATQRETLKEADSELKRFRDECDSIKDESRKDLTEWENVEKGRVENIKTWIQEIVIKGEVEYDSLDSINQALDELKAIKVETPLDNVYGEFAELAVRKIATAITNLSAAYIVRKKEEDDRAEAARLEAEQVEAERDKIIAERVEEAAREAKEEAARVADEKDRLAKEAVVAAEAGRLAANVATAKAERERKEAAEQAIKDAEAAKEEAEEEKLAAVEEEKQRQKENKKLQEKIALAREADEKNREKIIKEITEDILKITHNGELSFKIVKSIVAGEVRHVKVVF